MNGVVKRCLRRRFGTPRLAIDPSPSLRNFIATEYLMRDTVQLSGGSEGVKLKHDWIVTNVLKTTTKLKECPVTNDLGLKPDRGRWVIVYPRRPDRLKRLRVTMT